MNFPIIGAIRKDLLEAETEIGRIRSVPWDMIKPHENQARANHGQSLKKLAERGGLFAPEVVAILNNKTWREQYPDFQINKGISLEDYGVALQELHHKLDDWNSK